MLGLGLSSFDSYDYYLAEVTPKSDAAAFPDRMAFMVYPFCSVYFSTVNDAIKRNYWFYY
jgi:hypothetical protein